jgi:putative ABC transport system permease protein
MSRKLTVGLLVLSIALSSMLLIGVQKVKQSAKESFASSISDTDLIVGARSGDIQLLLYTVFRQGQAIANMSWESVNQIRNLKNVEWIVPISLGDSHRGFPVLGTTLEYFDRYKYGKKLPLSLAEGRHFDTPFEAVLGAEVADKLQYKIGQNIYLSHGMGVSSLALHKNKPFKVVGILERTHTPVDKTLHIQLEGVTALHVDWQNGRAPKQHEVISLEEINNMDLTPTSVTGAFVGLKSKFAIFAVQRKITEWESEPLMAILPGVTLSKMWGSISTIDKAFLIITVLVVLIAFIGLLLALFMSLQQRKRELMILRTMGAHPWQLFVLLMMESVMITVSGVVLGLGFMLSVGTVLQPFLERKMGLVLTLNQLTSTEFILAVSVVGVGIVTSIIPGILAYRKGRSEGSISL